MEVEVRHSEWRDDVGNSRSQRDWVLKMFENISLIKSTNSFFRQSPSIEHEKPIIM